MNNNLPGWDYLNRLAREYYEGVQKGYGTTIKNRSQRQIKLINEIVPGVRSFFYKQAMKLLFDSGCFLNTQKGIVWLGLKKNKYSVAYDRSTIEELTNVGCMELIKIIKNYDPNKGKLSTFINQIFVRMHKYATENYPLIRIPIYMHEKLNRIENWGIDEPKILDEIKSIVIKGDKDYFARNIHYSFENKTCDISEIEDVYNDEEFKQDRLNEEEKQDLERTIDSILKNFKERDREILKCCFGIGREEGLKLKEIGNMFGLTRERISKIKKKTLEKLSHSEKLRQFY